MNGVIFINLKELRINAGLTQEAAAKMLDLEQSAISHWEQGNTFPAEEVGTSGENLPL